MSKQIKADNEYKAWISKLGKYSPQRFQEHHTQLLKTIENELKD